MLVFTYNFLFKFIKCLNSSALALEQPMTSVREEFPRIKCFSE